MRCWIHSRHLRVNRLLMFSAKNSLLLPVDKPTHRWPFLAANPLYLPTTLLLNLSVFFLGILSCSAQTKPSEYAVKAAYLFNFGKFIRLQPADATTRPASFDICIVGQDPMGRALDEVTSNERLDERPVRVLRVKQAQDARRCSVVYVSSEEGKRIAADLDALRGSDALTVSDSPDFLRSGGMIQFVTLGNRIRFAINLEPVRRTHLALSSELLRVASSVAGNDPNGVQP